MANLPESIRFLVACGRQPERVAQLFRRINAAIAAEPQDRFVLGDEAAKPTRARLTDLFKGDLAVLTPLLWLGYFASSMAIFFSSSWGPLLLGLGFVPPALFLVFVVAGSVLVGGEHSGVISIAAMFYPSTVRATGGGWASSIGKIGGVLGPIFGALLLSSGLPVLRAYALLAACPAVLGLCVLGIAGVVRRRGRQTDFAATPVAGGISV